MSLLSLSFEALKERKLRAMLTTLMVVMGGSLLVAVNGISVGTVTYINDQFSTLGANLLVITPRSQNMKIDDSLVNDVLKIEGVADAVPFIQQISVIRSQGKTQSIVVMGLDQSKLSLIFPSLSIEEGNIVSSSDKIGILLGNHIVYSSKEVEPFTDIGQVVGIAYTESVQGKQVYQERSFSVRGILKNLGSSFIPLDQSALISLSAARYFFNRPQAYDGIYVITDSSRLNDRVRNLLLERYNVNVLSPKSIADTIERITSAISLFVNSVAGVSLLVASVGIITTLWTSMMERIREIGILKAIGFTDGKILRLFLNEAIIIGTIGGTIGLFLGVGLAYLMRNFFRGEILYVTPLFTAQIFVSAWVLCLGLSIISGFYPAWKASRLDPVVSLRHE